jgi:hypothetical protein
VPYLLLGVLTLGAGLGLGLGVSESPSATTSPITISLTLSQTRVRSGTPISGEVVFTNTSFKAITVQFCTLDGWPQVGLTNKQNPFESTSGLVGCRPSVRLRPGLNRFPVTFSTSYQDCLEPGGQSETYTPRCTANGQPALPVGHYMTKIFAFGLPAGTPAATPIRVTLLPTAG